MSTTLENKVFNNLFKTLTLEIQTSGEVEIFHQEEEEFYFVYHFHTDILEQLGAHSLTEAQAESLSQLAYDFYEANQPEEAPSDAFSHFVDMYDETGTHPSMFI